MYSPFALSYFSHYNYAIKIAPLLFVRKIIIILQSFGSIIVFAHLIKIYKYYVFTLNVGLYNQAYSISCNMQSDNIWIDAICLWLFSRLV